MTELAQSYRDTRLDIEERFLQPVLAGDRTVAVLSTSLAETRPMGWVFCHSFGMEQIDLQPFEVAAARQLAAAGYATLRFHAPGYGDSSTFQMETTEDSHLRALLDAVGLLVDQTGLSTVGLVGARFGGALAALAADRCQAAGLVLWNPVVLGRQYAAELLRVEAASSLIRSVETGERGPTPSRILAEEGLVPVQGGAFPLRKPIYEWIRSIDLTTQLTRFHGDSLVLQISRSPTIRKDLRELAERLEHKGGRCSLEAMTGEGASTFGFDRYRFTRHGTKKDVQTTISEAIVSRTVRWVAQLAAAGSDPLPSSAER
ncbi:MAG: alpha/beta fold hydrolase [Actinomycetota bacterium]|nr:alpha/beta fold hydrolase [Actinomycetota bacterium]